MTEEKPRIAYVDLKWLAAFDPDWLRLSYRADKKLQHRMVRKGDALLLELKSVS